MSTIWEMAQIIRAEEAAALAAKSEASQKAAAAHSNDERKDSVQRARGPASSLRTLVARLAHGKPGAAL